MEKFYQMFTTVVPWFCQVHGAIFSILAQDAGPACLHWSFPSKRRGPGLPSTRTVKTTEQARFPLLQVMRGRSSNWKDVDDCASVSRQTFAGRVGVMSACKCSLFGRDQKPHDPRRRTISSGRALAILCELAADHRSFSRFCFLFAISRDNRSILCR